MAGMDFSVSKSWVLVGRGVRSRRRHRIWPKTNFHILSDNSHTLPFSKLSSHTSTSTMASTSKLPPVDQIPSISTEEKGAVLDLLFEPSQQLHTLSIPILHNKFSSYDELIQAVDKQLTQLAQSASTSDTQWLLDILGSHPRLGAKKVESAQSQSEQAQLQGSSEEAEQLRFLNEEYEKAFPGLRYVVFVAGRSRPVIMKDMKKRIDGSDWESERDGAILVSI